MGLRLVMQHGRHTHDPPTLHPPSSASLRFEVSGQWSVVSSLGLLRRLGVEPFRRHRLVELIHRPERDGLPPVLLFADECAVFRPRIFPVAARRHQRRHHQPALRRVGVSNSMQRGKTDY